MTLLVDLEFQVRRAKMKVSMVTRKSYGGVGNLFIEMKYEWKAYV